jgi:hypothetical protein
VTLAPDVMAPRKDRCLSLLAVYTQTWRQAGSEMFSLQVWLSSVSFRFDVADCGFFGGGTLELLPASLHSGLQPTLAGGRYSASVFIAPLSLLPLPSPASLLLGTTVPVFHSVGFEGHT